MGACVASCPPAQGSAGTIHQMPEDEERRVRGRLNCESQSITLTKTAMITLNHVLHIDQNMTIRSSLSHATRYRESHLSSIACSFRSLSFSFFCSLVSSMRKDLPRFSLCFGAATCPPELFRSLDVFLLKLPFKGGWLGGGFIID